MREQDKKAAEYYGETFGGMEFQSVLVSPVGAHYFGPRREHYREANNDAERCRKDLPSGWRVFVRYETLRAVACYDSAQSERT